MLESMLEPRLTVVHDMDVASTLDTCPVFVNGVLIGTVCSIDATLFCDNVRAMRRAQSIPFDCSISRLDGWVHISSDPGCLLRPVIVADRLADFIEITHRTSRNVQTCGMVWDELVSAGVVEYIDKHEETMCTVALSPSEIVDDVHTHCEVHPALIMGVCALLIPCEQLSLFQN
tara:strand:- start:17 stop:538 length:522 start_codon:yes stop_codon:yes gene_type:complete